MAKSKWKKICEHCKREFLGRESHTKYCSNECRGKAKSDSVIDKNHARDVAKYYEEIKSLVKTGKKFGHDHYTTRKLIVLGGGNLPVFHAKSRSLSDEEIVEIYKTGVKTLKEIAEIANTHYIVILRILQRLGVRKPGDPTPRKYFVKHGIGSRANKLKTAPQRYLRTIVVLKMGGICGNCGNKDLRVLCLNHINGRNKKESPLLEDCMKIYNGEKVDHLEILCYNCNTIHEFERGNIQDYSSQVKNSFETFKDWFKQNAVKYDKSLKRKHGLSLKAKEIGVPPQRFGRMITILKMGGVCNKCSCNDLRVLCINHIDGKNKDKSKYKDCMRILNGERLNYLEVLCCNCNKIHEYERGNIKDLISNFVEEYEKLKKEKQWEN